MIESRLILSSIALGLASAFALPEGNPSPVQVRAAEETGGPNCNNATNRACWRSAAPAEPTGFNVDTDSEKVWPSGVNQGARTTTYSLTIAEKTLSPDGTPKLMQVINGVYPGPVIEANWGDTVVVLVTNKLKDNGTSMHWHGLVQANTTTQDGVNGITECPIEPGATRRYEWVATQHGTSWYHSHYSGQYGDGVLGPIKINGPATANYDEDLGTFAISDLYENNMYQTGLEAELKGPPKAKGAMINGQMKNAQGLGKYAEVSVEKGKTYRLRLINTAVDAGWKVSLDNHPFQVIAADFVPINGFNTDWLFIGIGQRYDVVFTANQTSDRYWFRVETPTAFCANNALSNPTTKKHSIFAVFGYKDKPSTADPTSKAKAAHDGKCQEETGMTPRLTKPVPSAEFTFVDGPSDQLKVSNGQKEVAGQKVNIWSINDSEINVEWENPTIEYVANNTLSVLKAKPGNNIYELPQANKFYFWVIQNGPVPHPIHLHGHDFYILGQASGKKFVKDTTKELNFKNPLRRDVAMLPENGYLVIAIFTDNPGVWLMHCHIGFHISMGLGVQFVEREPEIRSMKSNGLATMQQNCNSWDKWYNTTVFKKPDSGLRRPGSGIGK